MKTRGIKWPYFYALLVASAIFCLVGVSHCQGPLFTHSEVENALPQGIMLSTGTKNDNSKNAANQREFQNIYHELQYPLISTGIAQNFTIVNSSMTNLTVTNLTATNILGGGLKIKQIVPFSIATSSTNTTQTFVNSTVSASITLSAGSTVYIFASVSVAGAINVVGPGTLFGMDLRWVRGAATTLTDTFTFGQAFGFNSQVASLTDAQQGTVVMFDYDFPNTTSAVAYTLQFRNSQGTGQAFVNTATLLSSVNSETSGFLIEVGS